jgi:hypothetical protein
MRARASATLPANISDSRFWTGAQCPASPAARISAISSSVQPSCLARAMIASRSSTPLS